MTIHKCDKATCPPAHLNGPKIKCYKCGKVCYLQCFGFQPGAKINEQDTVKMASSGILFTTFISCMAFSCCSDQLTDDEQKFTLKLPSTARSQSRGRPSKQTENESMIANELSNIKGMLQMIKTATEANTADIAEIKSTTTSTDANVKKATEQGTTSGFFSPAMNYANNYRERMYARAAAANAKATGSNANATPSSHRKRPRQNEPESLKSKFPEAKVGTKPSGLSVVPKPIRAIVDKNKFAKALVVSRLDPATTNEELADYIATNTPVTDKTMFNVHKMVKKDADLSALKFVSFKVELNGDEFELLENVELWPQGATVREFTQVPERTFGDFLPRNQPASSHPPPTGMEM